MNPVTMTIINLRKQLWLSRGSNQRPPVLKSATLPTMLWGSAIIQHQQIASTATTTTTQKTAPATTTRPQQQEQHNYQTAETNQTAAATIKRTTTTQTNQRAGATPRTTTTKQKSTCQSGMRMKIDNFNFIPSCGSNRGKNKE